MPEENVMFNSQPLPPPEYLMRRSHNAKDAEIPGAIIREWRCTLCGEIDAKDDLFIEARLARKLCTRHGEGIFPTMEIHSVDVPLLKADGERWR